MPSSIRPVCTIPICIRLSPRAISVTSYSWSASSGSPDSPGSPKSDRSFSPGPFSCCPSWSCPLPLPSTIPWSPRLSSVPFQSCPSPREATGSAVCPGSSRKNRPEATRPISSSVGIKIISPLLFFIQLPFPVCHHFPCRQRNISVPAPCLFPWSMFVS